MITKALSKIKIHPFVFIICFLSIITGLIKSFFIMYMIVIIHELGHVFFAYIFDYNIKSITIYPFGGYTKFDTLINNSFISELLVFLGGILFQLILRIIFNLLVDSNSYVYYIFNNYNKIIILFNLLPIIPLDGSKIINIIFNKLLNYKISHLLMIYISFINVVIILIIYYKDLNIILMSLILFYFSIYEYKNHKYIFNRFLLERYLYRFRFSLNNFINGLNFNKMKKYKNNIFVVDNKYVEESEALEFKYKKNKP